MAAPAPGAAYDVVCLHCKKRFRGELISDPESRFQGFKCPHCRLFVPFERADGSELIPGPEPA